MKNINCQICNKEIRIYPYQEGRVRFCSHVCWSASCKKEWKELVCLCCKKLFLIPPWRVKEARYCSASCRTKDTVAGYWLGKERESMVGEKNWDWKGDKVSYRALHLWVRRWKGAPKACEQCGKEKTTPKSIHWANRSKKYLRDFNDWVALCCKCHKAFDKVVIASPAY